MLKTVSIALMSAILFLGDARSEVAFLAWRNAVATSEAMQNGGRYEEALSVLESALKDAPPGSLVQAGIETRMGDIYQDLGRYFDAERVYKKSLSTCRELGSPGLDLSAVTLNDIGSLRIATDRPSQALESLQEALRIREQISHPNDKAFVPLFNNLGTVALEMHDQVAAEEYYRRALALSEAAFGARSLDTAVTLNNLAGLNFAQRRFAEAAERYEEGVSVLRSILGPKHPALGLALSNLLVARLSQGRLEDAEAAAEEALAVFTVALPEDHPRRGILLSQYAELLRRTGRRKEARRMKKQAREIIAAYQEQNLFDHTVDISTLMARR